MVDYFHFSTKHTPIDPIGTPHQSGKRKNCSFVQSKFSPALLMQYYTLQDLAVARIVPSETRPYTVKAFGVGYPPLPQCKKGELTKISWYVYTTADLRNGTGFIIPPGMANHLALLPAPNFFELLSTIVTQVVITTRLAHQRELSIWQSLSQGRGIIEMFGYFKPKGCLTSKGTVAYGAPCATFLATPIGWYACYQ